MDARLLWSKCTTVLSILFGSSKMPPLSRKAFVREATFLFLVRGVVAWSAIWLLVWLARIDIYSEEPIIEWWQALSMLFFACIYYIPWIRIMHRRLLMLSFPYTKILIFALLIAWVYVVDALPVYNPVCSTAINLALEISVYLFLLPWPDRWTPQA